MSTRNFVVVQTAIVDVGVALAVGLTVAGVSEYAILVVALVFGLAAGIHAYRFVKRREAADAASRARGRGPAGPTRKAAPRAPAPRTVRRSCRRRRRARRPRAGRARFRP